MKKITKAVIPAAGLGTRMLPISVGVPKEMLPIVDLPACFYLVEEAVKSGISDILIVTNRDKEAIENFFDYSPEYEARLLASGKTELAARLRAIADMANVTFIRQKEALGLGHAVARAKNFVGDEHFVVLYGDDIIFSDTPVCRQLIDAYEAYGLGAVGVKAVPMEDVRRYCSLKVEPLAGKKGLYHCTDMIEKPKPGEEFSNLSILGRVLLPPSIFGILEDLPRGAGGEYQLTDAMAILSRREGVSAVDFEGTRYDLGSKLGFLMANVVRGVAHEEVGAEFTAFLKEFVKELP